MANLRPTYFKLNTIDPAHPNLPSPNEPNVATGRKLTKYQKFVACVVTICLLIVVAVCIASTQSNALLGRNARTSSTDRRFTLDDVFSGKYAYESYEADWVSDKDYLHIADTNHLEQYDVESGERTVIIANNETKDVKDIKVKDISPDKNWFLFANNSKSLYRHSFYADYYVKNLKTNKIKKLRTPKDDDEQIRYCGWSSTGSALVFVHKCNIYYVPRIQDHTNYYLITGNGVPKKIFNGVPDWVYEEEIVSDTKAIEFSKDGKFMSYVMFNATLVPFFRFSTYGPPDNMYPSIERIAYPKAGFPNPTIRITIVDIDTTIKRSHAPRNHIQPPKEISRDDYYYTMMKFNEKNQLFVQWVNRAQNKTICMLYGMRDPVGYIVEEHEVEHGWIDDDYQAPLFSKDGSYYITMLAQPVPGKGDFRHLAKVTVDDPKLKNNFEFLTAGAWTVQDIKCWNSDEGMIYFRSTEVSPRFRHVYSYNLTSKEKKCVSCGLLKDEGTDCTYHYPQFSTQCSWMILLCQGPFLPKSSMFNLKDERETVLVTNNSTRQALKEKDLPDILYYSVKSDGFNIPVKETRPKNFDPKRKYAVLFDVYGGPNTQSVLDQFGLYFNEYLVTNFDIIGISFDARGSGYYGNQFLYAVYRNLGIYEARDALAVAKSLQRKSYVDPDRISIWGWSYGGFFAATALAMSDGVINTATAVAPVTDWRYYDTVYTERYMGLPSKDDNLDGYVRTSVLEKVKDFEGKNFLLIHGTADDNVHFQNSAQLASALIKAKVDFRSQFYPDKNHGINPRTHLFQIFGKFLEEKLNLQEV